ncbi:MAG: SDR family oxidoreductase [Pseudohongiellaceae bacterium]
MKLLLTGASGGIGSAIAHQLNSLGVELILQGRDRAALNNVAAALTRQDVPCELVEADLNVLEQRQHLINVAKTKKIDALINNAGVNLFGPFQDSDIAALIQTNVICTMELTQALLPTLLESDTSKIVNIGSAFGSIGYPGYATYCASKFAIKGFTEALHREFSSTNLSVLYVSPRATQTKMNSDPVMALNNALGVTSDSVDLVARQVVKSILTDRKRTQIGLVEYLQTKINACAPFLVDRAIAKQLSTIQSYF